jgi:hypothetical protein
MRGSLATIIIIVSAVLVLLLYFVFGRTQIYSALDKVQGEIDDYQAQVTQIQVMAAELPQLKKDLPLWRQQLKLLKSAIPARIDDDKFLASLAEQMKLQGVDLLRINMANSAGWLSKANEGQLKKLNEYGIDVTTAKKIQATFYSIELSGKFDKVITAFENLKKYRRLYSVDEIAGPVGGGAGEIMQVVDPEITPLQVTGKIFYGIPDDYLSIALLDKVFADAVAVPIARGVQRGVANTARKLIADDNKADQGGQAGKEQP